MDLGRYKYEEQLCPVPKHKLDQEDKKSQIKVKSWKRRRPDPTGIVPASRLQRLDMTPKRFRTILWAAEHIVGNSNIRRKWQRLAMDLHLEYDDIEHVIDDDISTDEKFYEVMKSKYFR